MDVLVTGGGGLLGRELARVLTGRGREVYAPGRADLDVTDPDAVGAAVRGLRPVAVVHCAAMTDVDACEREPDRAWTVNAQAPGIVAEAAASVGAEVIAISTDYVFDGTKGAAYTEDDEPNPIQVYGRAKLAGEDRVRAATDAHVVVRSAWIYGADGKNFISRLPALLVAGTPVRAVADQTGSPTFAPDLAVAVADLVGSGVRGTRHVVNAGACTIADVCRRMLAVLGAEVEVTEVTRAQLGLPAARPENSSLAGAAPGTAGFTPLRAWQEAVEVFVREAVAA